MSHSLIKLLIDPFFPGPAPKPDVDAKILALLRSGDAAQAMQSYRADYGGDEFAARISVDRLKATL